MDGVERKFRVWEGLVDSSIYFALAGLRAQGFRKKVIKSRLKKRWERALAEHHQANLEIAKRIYARGGRLCKKDGKCNS